MIPPPPPPPRIRRSCSECMCVDWGKFRNKSENRDYLGGNSGWRGGCLFLSHLNRHAIKSWWVQAREFVGTSKGLCGHKQGTLWVQARDFVGTSKEICGYKGHQKGLWNLKGKKKVHKIGRVKVQGIKFGKRKTRGRYQMLANLMMNVGHGIICKALHSNVISKRFNAGYKISHKTMHALFTNLFHKSYSKIALAFLRQSMLSKMYPATCWHNSSDGLSLPAINVLNIEIFLFVTFGILVLYNIKRCTISILVLYNIKRCTISILVLYNIKSCTISILVCITSRGAQFLF